MAKSVRIHPTISLVAHQHLEAAIASGETMSSVINRLLIHQLPKPGHTTTAKTADLNRLLKDLRARLVPYNQKIENGTITFAERDVWYGIVEQIAKTKTTLGMETRDVDEIMQEHYHREYRDLQDEFDYETIRYEAGHMTEEGEKIYKEIEQRINVLKDRLK